MLNQVISDVDVPIFLMKFALAFWVAIAFLQWIDRRATIISMIVALYLCVAVLSGYLVLQPAAGSLVYAIGASTFAACFGCLLALKAWVQPASDATTQSASPQEKPALTGGLLFWCSIVGVAVMLASVYLAALQVVNMDNAVDTRALDTRSLLHSFCTSAMWGVTLAVAIEMTVLSSPSDLEAVAPGGDDMASTRLIATAANWSRAAWFALSLLLMEVALCGSLVLLPQQTEGRSLVPQLFAWMFALSVLVVQFIGWMIPHRLHNFQRSGKVQEWTTLMLSAWIAFLALGVTAALPVHWPWTML